MSDGKVWLSIIFVVSVVLLCGVGILFIKVDVFSRLGHRMAVRHQNFSRKFGTFFLVFSIVWLIGALWGIWLA